jgi:hypothetical protein
LLILAGTAEGFPRPLISPALLCPLFVLGLVTSIAFLWKGGITFELVLYSVFPVFLFFIFDEISTSYKTPLLLVCALLLSLGILGYHWFLRKDSVTLAWLILLLAVLTTWLFASHAVQNYWQMVGQLSFPADCMPYAQDCPLISGSEMPWWVLLFRL